MKDFAVARRRMVEQQLRRRGIDDPRVLDAMGAVPRHLFVEEALQDQAYSDFSLPIGLRQTISQPYMVAVMTRALEMRGGEKVLEVGTGSGYQAAVLARIAGRVFSLERHAELARRARRVLDTIGCAGVHIKVSDGTVGWEDQAPFDGIIVTAGAPAVPHGFRRQLAVGGRLVIPLGDRRRQVLVRMTRTGEESFLEERLMDCRFVPLVGEAGWGEDEG